MHFLPPKQSDSVSNVAFLPDSSFSKQEGPPPPEQETDVGTGGESSNPGSHLCQSTGSSWEGHPPLGCRSSHFGCGHHHWGSHQLIREAWNLHGRNNSPGSQALTEALAPPPYWVTPDFLHPLHLPANCLMACDLYSTSKAEAGKNSRSSSMKSILCSLTFGTWAVIP